MSRLFLLIIGESVQLYFQISNLFVLNKCKVYFVQFSEVMFLFLSDTCQAFGCHGKPLWRVFSSQALWADSGIQEVNIFISRQKNDDFQ